MPGIAGIVLTIGMGRCKCFSVRKNKRGIKSGRSIMNSRFGLQIWCKNYFGCQFYNLNRGTSPFNYGSGPIKGFITLSIGIVTSMFVKLVLTKLLVTI